MSAELNVLVVSGGGFQGLAVLKGLRRLESVRIVLADCYKQIVGQQFAHRSYVVPRIERTDEFRRALFEICRRERIDLAIPSTDYELPFLAREREEFDGRGVKVAISGERFLDVMRHKGRLYGCLAEHGIAVLPTFDRPTNDGPFPLIGKPVRGWGGRGLIVVNSPEELSGHDLDALEDKYVWQPYLTECQEFSLDFAIGFAQELSPISIRRRIRTAGGFAVIAQSADDAVLRQIGERTAGMIAVSGGCGLFNVQLLRQHGRCFVSDVNPRVGVSSVFALGEGLNLPGFLCECLRAPQATAPVSASAPRRSPPPPRARMTMIRRLEESFVEEIDLSRTEAIVFDLDDTLLNHKAWMAGKLDAVQQSLAAELPERAEFLERAIWRIEEGRRADLFDVLAADFGFSDALKARLIAAYRAATPSDDRLFCGPLLFCDVLPTLRELRARGLKTAVLTDNPVESQRQKIASTGLADRCDAIVYCRELGLEKPAAIAFEEVARRLSVAPEQLVMVGDHLYRDVQGALAAGCLHAFLVQRPGACLNIDVDLFRRLHPDMRSFSLVAGVQEILGYLPGDSISLATFGGGGAT